MILTDAVVISVRTVAEGTKVLTFASEAIAASTMPGQFVNIRVHGGNDPLLRRPFSVSRVADDKVEILFNIVGAGTELLSKKQTGETINVLGPLGKPFHVEGSFRNAILLAGGLGVAPMPLLTRRLQQGGKHIETFLGARTALHLATDHLENVHVATDDGSRGFHGTVVRLAEEYLNEHPIREARLFVCGPTPMLQAAAALSSKTGIPGEISLEGDMACGIGICQGCPVERKGGDRKYGLVCTDGPAFPCDDIVFAS